MRDRGEGSSKGGRRRRRGCRELRAQMLLSHRQPHGAASGAQAGLCRAPPAASTSALHPSSSPAEQATDPCGSVLRIDHDDDSGRGERSQAPCLAWAGDHPLLPECAKLGRLRRRGRQPSSWTHLPFFKYTAREPRAPLLTLTWHLRLPKLMAFEFPIAA